MRLGVKPLEFTVVAPDKRHAPSFAVNNSVLLEIMCVMYKINW